MNANDVILLKNFEESLLGKCSPKQIIKNQSGEAVAVECNCGKYHPILGGKTLRGRDEVSSEVLDTMVEKNVSYARILAEL